MLYTYLKNSSINAFAFLLLTLFTFSICANEDQESGSIRDVIESFKSAIEAKDEALFMSLFHDQNISWVGVLSDDTLNTLIAKDEKFKAQPKIINSTPEEFIDNIVKSSQVNKEVFNNVKINTDKEVASVSFDYEFFKGEKMSNFGQEHWQLINTKNGWKINAVNFSYTMAL